MSRGSKWREHMKNSDLRSAMNDVDEKYILGEEPDRRKRRAGKKRWAVIGAAAACACLAVGAAVWHSRHSLNIMDPGLTQGGGQDDPGDYGGPDSQPVSGAQTGSGNTGGSGSQPGGGAQTGSGNTGSSGSQPGETDAELPADYAIVQARYPESLSFPEKADFTDISGNVDFEAFNEAVGAYLAEWGERVRASEHYQGSLYPFYGKTMKQLLVREEAVNRAYSPLNLYIALSMLAELTDGESREQLLALLDAQEIGAVRESVSALWSANYSEGGYVTSTLANSLWLRQGESFVPETMQRLADVYHASSFQGDMGSEEFAEALRTWVNAQTGGMLQEQAGALRMDENTVLELVSTVYFRAQWKERFYEDNTAPGTFHAAEGDMICDFMHRSGIQNYYRGDNFSAVCCDLTMSGGVWLFLPDEGVSVNEVIGRGEALRLLEENYGWENRKTVVMNLAMPKFDIVSDIDLVEELKAMGVTDIFDVQSADFSLMQKDKENLFVGEAKHAARVSVDEKGCSAAAFTVIAVNDGIILVPDEIDFTLDRPFLFAVTGADGSVLFAGVVETVE